MWLDNFRIEKGGDEAWSSSESGFSVRKSGRPVSSKGAGRRPVRNLPVTVRENYGYFFPKTGLSVRFKILSIWVAAPR